MALCGSSYGAQSPEAPARIAGPIREQSRVVLHGNVATVVQAQYDRGEASGSSQLTHMRVVLTRSADQQAALDRFEQELQDNSSPNYHKWITPQEFGRRYGPADSDIAAIVAWLQSHGLAVAPVSPGRTNIDFSGTVSQVEEAFDTSIHSYEINGQRFYSNNTNPSIPSALAPLIQGIAHLNTWSPRPTSIRADPGRMDPASQRLVPIHGASEHPPRPALNPGGGTLYLVPGDAATIYDTPNPALNANDTSATKYDGTGVTIGVGGTSLIKTNTVQNYRSNFLGNTIAPILTNIDGVTFTGGSTEPYIDVEIAGGLAPGATIHYYVANDLITPIDQALTDNTVDIFTFTYDVCEKFNSTADNAAISKLWEQAATQGIAVTVATGDSGSAGCDDPTDSNGQDTAAAVKGLAVNAYASTPYNIAVGGTDFDLLDRSFSSYSTTGGSAATYYRTALKYIPEATWNDSTQANNAFTNNQPWGIGPSVFPANVSGGGGGPSNCAANNTSTNPGSCISGYSKPSWQRGAGVPADGVRDLPDISLMAGNGFYDATWLVCDDSTNASSNLPDDCSTQSDGSFNFAAYGGTSTAAPAFAGILALVEQSTGGRLGQAAAQLYNLYNGSHASQIFHDVTQGNNSVSCTQGSPNCKKNAAGYYFEAGYNAAAGYDLATGLGSVDTAQLINDWNTATSGATATVAVTPTSDSIAVNQSVSVAVTVTGSGGLLTPSGTVALTGGGYTSSAETLLNGAYTFTIPANSLSVGTDSLTVTYSGDTNYASTTGTANVTVTAVVIPPTFTLSATSPSAIAPGVSVASAVTIQSANGYTGVVTLSCALTSAPAGATNLPTCSTSSSVSLSSTATAGAGTVSVTTTAPATGSLQPSSPGNLQWFTAAGGSGVLALLIFFVPARTRRWRHICGVWMLAASIGFVLVGCGSSSSTGSGSGGGSAGSGGGGTAAKTTPTVKLSPANTSIVLNTPVSVALAVTGSGTTTPTGTIALASGSYSSAAATLTGGAATITIPASTLPAGQDLLTASYSGDSNYNPATGKATLTAMNPPLVGGTTPGSYTFMVTGTGNDAANTSATTTFTIIVS
ncbi:MAG TPA: protease pro-enzyme activation domain-containing protein [Acidobacteriaceae bacterium]|nr:protease pro-enzyme activation domain-containing protein [Acidobacteriaceae bacterium]